MEPLDSPAAEPPQTQPPLTFEVDFLRINGEVLTLRDLTPTSSLDDLRRSVLQQLPEEPPLQLMWFLYGGMPLPDGVVLDSLGPRPRVWQYSPDPSTVAALAALPIDQYRGPADLDWRAAVRQQRDDQAQQDAGGSHVPPPPPP
mmetsp:Transcript_9263/g.15567  ORF Transcript_9263/g.15567 Transcript_9263/m.15567 type:complete len:144 (-) Transcript_9263:301-732(-)